MEPTRTIVLADDHREVRSLLRAILEGEWHILSEAANGVEAVELCRTLQPDIVVLDVSMPVMNGIEAATLIASSCDKTKIVMLSVLESANIVRQSLGAGAKAYVVKNHAASVLLAALEAVQRGEVYLCPSIQPGMGLGRSNCA